MSSLYKGPTCPLGEFIRVGSIESIEHPDMWETLHKSCILRVNKIRVNKILCTNLCVLWAWDIEKAGLVGS